MARGSLAEIEYYIHLLGRLESTGDRGEALTELADSTGALLFGLIRSLSKKLNEKGRYYLKEDDAVYGGPSESNDVEDTVDP